MKYNWSIRDLQKQAYEQSKEKGFHDNDGSCYDPTFGDRIALCHSELSEAIEAYRNYGNLQSWVGLDGKSEGVPSELADTVIRIADMCETYGIDLQEAIENKLAYNKTRPYLHGKKF